MLVLLRDAMAAVPGVATCRVGMEANLTPADYPMVRLVPTSIRWGDVMTGRRCELLVYFGKPLHEFSAGLEALYADLFALEAALLAAAQSVNTLYVRFEETILDEDKLDAYKLMALRLTVEG